MSLLSSCLIAGKEGKISFLQIVCSRLVLMRAEWIV